jgi:hypothetical protein
MNICSELSQTVPGLLAVAEAHRLAAVVWPKQRVRAEGTSWHPMVSTQRPLATRRTGFGTCYARLLGRNP